MLENSKIIAKHIKHVFWDEPNYKRKTKIDLQNADKFQVEVLNSVSTKGYYLSENYFKKKDVEVMLNTCMDYAKNIKSSDKHLSLPEYGTDRFLHADDNQKLALFFSTYFDDIGNRYLGGYGKRYQSMFERKGKIGKVSSSDIPHFDDWKKRFKIFLYLNDVDDKNCPFVIFENSYNYYEGRRFKELEYVLGEKKSSFGTLCHIEELMLLKNPKIKKITIKAKAGSVIFVDTRFIHCGSASVKGKQRYLLGSYFDIR